MMKAEPKKRQIKKKKKRGEQKSREQLKKKIKMNPNTKTIKTKTT